MRSTSKRPRTTERSWPGPGTRRSTRFTRRAASSAAIVKRRVRCRRFSWARTTSSPCTAATISSGTSRICSSRPPLSPRPLAELGSAPLEVPAGPAHRRRPQLMQAFLTELDRRVLVCDGAMGTMLYARGIFLNRCFDELNLTHPDLVAAIHREYLDAGADVIETN